MIKLIYAELKNPELSLGSRRLTELNKNVIRVMELAQTFVIYTFPCVHAYADTDKQRLEQLIQTGHCDSA